MRVGVSHQVVFSDFRSSVSTSRISFLALDMAVRQAAFCGCRRHARSKWAYAEWMSPICRSASPRRKYTCEGGGRFSCSRSWRSARGLLRAGDGIRWSPRANRTRTLDVKEGGWAQSTASALSQHSNACHARGWLRGGGDSLRPRRDYWRASPPRTHHPRKSTNNTESPMRRTRTPFRDRSASPLPGDVVGVGGEGLRAGRESARTFLPFDSMR